MWEKKGKIFDKEWAQLPVVDVSEGYYTIYYSTRDENGCSIPKQISIHKSLSSPPSRRFNVNIPLGKPGSFDSHGIMPTEIITLEDGTKYLYYIGWSKRLDVPYWNSIGLAISEDDGVTWKKYSEGPIFSSNSKDPNFIGTISVIQTFKKIAHRGFKEEWSMIYSSANWENVNGKLEPVYGIRGAISSNGIDWTPINYEKFHIDLEEDEGGIASARVLKDKIYYSIRKKTDYRTNPNNSYKIKSQFLKNKDYYPYEFLELEPEGDELMCAYPFVIEEKNRDIMFYNTDFGKSGISYAIREHGK